MDALLRRGNKWKEDLEPSEKEGSEGEEDSLEDAMEEDEEDDEGNLKGFVENGGDAEEAALAADPEASRFMHRLHDKHRGSTTLPADNFAVYIEALLLEIVGQAVEVRGLGRALSW